MRFMKIDARLWRYLFVLYKLTELGANRRTVKVSTGYLAEKIGSSQQTASRHLILLEKAGWIERGVTREGSLVKITDSGMAELKRVYSGLRLLLEAKHPLSITLEGHLFTGIGEGAYYVTNEGYRKQFLEKLGFDPYPGTLNIRLSSEYDVKARLELESYPPKEIAGFQNEHRTFGPVRCYPATINNEVEGAVVLAVRSHYNASVLELIAPNFLRNKLKLKDGHKVKVEVHIPPQP